MEIKAPFMVYACCWATIWEFVPNFLSNIKELVLNFLRTKFRHSKSRTFLIFPSPVVACLVLSGVVGFSTVGSASSMSGGCNFVDLSVSEMLVALLRTAAHCPGRVQLPCRHQWTQAVIPETEVGQRCQITISGALHFQEACPQCSLMGRGHLQLWVGGWG